MVTWRSGLRWTWSLILLQMGVLCYVFAIRSFYIPNHLLSGGVTGIALLLHLLFKWPVGLLTFLFNVPIFVLGIRDIGKKFALLSGLAVTAFWVIVDHVPIPPATHDHLLAAIFGGLLSGLATALTLKAGGSMGGFDILGVVVNRRFSLGVGEVSLILNGMLISAAGLIENLELAMYTLVAIYVAGRSLDAIQLPRPRKAVLVFSKNNDWIKARILSEMGRGVSLFKAVGAFSGEEHEALLCIVTRYELREIRDIIRAGDPEAFVSVLEASDVIGRFQRPSAFDLLASKRSGK